MVTFTKKYLGSYDYGQFISMNTWISERESTTVGDFLLQMDVEGGEYFSLINLDSSWISRFRIMVIEFHGLKKLGNPEFFRIVRNVFLKLTLDHCVVHIHPNNGTGTFKIRGLDIPDTLEFTFLRRDRITFSAPQYSFPHILDSPNTHNRDLQLPGIWFQA